MYYYYRVKQFIFWGCRLEDVPKKLKWLYCNRCRKKYDISYYCDIIKY